MIPLPDPNGRDIRCVRTRSEIRVLSPDGLVLDAIAFVEGRLEQDIARVIRMARNDGMTHARNQMRAALGLIPETPRVEVVPDEPVKAKPVSDSYPHRRPRTTAT